MAIEPAGEDSNGLAACLSRPRMPRLAIPACSLVSLFVPYDAGYQIQDLGYAKQVFYR